jgi:hypothetical protein
MSGLPRERNKEKEREEEKRLILNNIIADLNI